MSEEEKIKAIYKRIRYREKITEEELEEKLEENIVAIYLAMENFEDKLYSRMTERVEQLKEYIERLKESERINQDNFDTLGADIVQVKKDLGLDEDLIISEEMVEEINKKYIDKDIIRKIKENTDTYRDFTEEVIKLL